MPCAPSQLDCRFPLGLQDGHLAQSSFCHPCSPADGPHSHPHQHQEETPTVPAASSAPRATSRRARLSAEPRAGVMATRRPYGAAGGPRAQRGDRSGGAGRFEVPGAREGSAAATPFGSARLALVAAGAPLRRLPHPTPPAAGGAPLLPLAPRAASRDRARPCRASAGTAASHPPEGGAGDRGRRGGGEVTPLVGEEERAAPGPRD